VLDRTRLSPDALEPWRVRLRALVDGAHGEIIS
jgi:hypothetical protein